MESSHSISRSASRESSRIEEELIFEISYTSHKNLKTAIKAALFVGSLLLAGGAVVSSFTIGMPGVIAFSVASGATMVAFTALCISSYSKSEPDLEPEIENREKETNPFAKITDSELFQMWVPSDSESAPNKSIENEIELRIRSTFLAFFKSSEEEEIKAIAVQLQPLFDCVKNDKDKLSRWIEILITSNSSKYYPLFLAFVLENIQWPDVEQKNELLVLAFGHLFADPEFCDLVEEVIDLGDEGLATNASLKCNKLTIKLQKIFGHDDFDCNPKEIPGFLFGAIGLTIHAIADAKYDDIKRIWDAGFIDPDRPVGIKLSMAQRRECRFPASMMSPLLPYLKQIPGLIGLHLFESGVHNKRNHILRPEHEESIYNGSGFSDDDVGELTAILRSNPHLIDVCINTTGMSKEKEAELLAAWQQVLNSKDFIVSSIRKNICESDASEK